MDTHKQYGASGLYEIYTHAKLDFDGDKVAGRDAVSTARPDGNSLNSSPWRCMEPKTLELDFQSTLDELARGSRALRRRLTASRHRGTTSFGLN
jgi:hypothetical protein